MAIYSETNSFFQLNNDINYGCVDGDAVCLPILNVADLIGFKLITNDNPIVPIDAVDEATFPLVSYSYRIVKSCNEPVIPLNSVKIYTEFFYVKDPILNKWLLMPLNPDSGITPEDFIFPNYQILQCDDCFFIQIIKSIREPNPDQDINFPFPYMYRNTKVGCIGCFKKICEPCYTTFVSYRNRGAAFGFNYSFIINNTVRLPLYLKQPQFQTVRNVFTLSNGDKKKLSARIEKEWLVETDWMPKEWHEKLVIALEHDDVLFVNINANYSSKIMMESSYEIEWQDFLNHPLAKAKFKVKQIPYNNVNSNCI